MAALVACAAALAPKAAPSVTLTTTRVVAETGTPSPDGTNTAFFLIGGRIVLGDGGQAAFTSDLRDPQGFLQGGALLRAGSRQDLVMIARCAPSVGSLAGWPAPDGNGNFYPFDEPDMAVNASGEVAFAARLTGTFNPAEASGIFRGSGGMAGLVQIARGNEVIPGGSDQIKDLLTGAAPSIDDAGDVGFAATWMSGAAFVQGVLRGNGAAQSLTELAHTGELSPGGGPTFFQLTHPLPLNQSGTTAFEACLGTSCSDIGVYRSDGVDTTAIALAGDPSPDGNGSLSILIPYPPAINDSGEVAFFSMLSGTAGGSSDDEGIFRGDGSKLVAIARRGDDAGGNGRLLDIDSNSIVMNDLGQVLFTSTITGATGGSSQGVFRSDGGARLVIARIGQPTPTGVGTFSGFTPLSLALNGAGQAVFAASIDLGNGGSPKDTTGLYRYDDHRGLRELVRPGDVVPGTGVVDGFDFAGATNGQGEGASGLNAKGQVAYRLSSGGNYHVAIVPEPEGAGLGGAAGAALGLVSLRRRRRAATRASARRAPLRPHLDGADAHDRTAPRPRHRLVEVCAFDHDEPAEDLLGLREGPVAHEHVATLPAQRGGRLHAGEPQARAECAGALELLAPAAHVREHGADSRLALGRGDLGRRGVVEEQRVLHVPHPPTRLVDRGSPNSTSESGGVSPGTPGRRWCGSGASRWRSSPAGNPASRRSG
jgi:hypothetical protein